MKTWEVYKIALENPEARFKRVDDETGFEYFFELGKPKFMSQDSVVDSSWDLIRTNYEWELIREPVDFMTAVNSGKNIRPCTTSGNSFHHWSFWALSINGINGKWYIE